MKIKQFALVGIVLCLQFQTLNVAMAQSIDPVACTKLFGLFKNKEQCLETLSKGSELQISCLRSIWKDHQAFEALMANDVHRYHESCDKAFEKLAVETSDLDLSTHIDKLNQCRVKTLRAFNPEQNLVQAKAIVLDDPSFIERCVQSIEFDLPGFRAIHERLLETSKKMTIMQFLATQWGDCSRPEFYKDLKLDRRDIFYAHDASKLSETAFMEGPELRMHRVYGNFKLNPLGKLRKSIFAKGELFKKYGSCNPQSAPRETHAQSSFESSNLAR